MQSNNMAAERNIRYLTCHLGARTEEPRIQSLEIWYRDLS